MHHRLLRLSLLILLVSTPAAAASAEGNCWVVAIAMNQDEAASEAWNQYGEEFARVFTDHAKPLFKSVQAKTIVGREARQAEIVSAMR